MTRDLKIMAGLVVTILVLLIGLLVRQGADEYPASLLILTRDGCAYAQSIGIKTEQNKGQCVTVARYRPYVFGDGGVVHLEGNQKIVVTNSMLLAYRKSDVELPLTPDQQSVLRWFRAWQALALMLGTATIIYWLGPWGRSKGKSK
ncbi:MAG: hypothetical protein PHH47_11590 [Gallionella sp.]|nr:hypothetical protein [Gallionella sp.]MDD4947386.1 hypothetical protein [Gallionella sp.]MDD5613094.1 hypothetical protein [Gallionella sp.]